ncbi:hypothetical protein HOT29_gp085 [Microbacterium phage Squash]|uniref:Uncharacterized protein n=1 Tax=Microbacterium phage Squash TaxID=2182357 RepID=A0A2U8UM89_9CAUD|nr:hypothetical protein HOT29_gp085 [Microbacterium phage Squash]AWN04703.1 hypothetical protein PBI_SQUASH_85 [Microbacterium phage Squash]
MSDQPADDRSTQVDQAPTLGEMADVMRDWQARGVTLASVRYVIPKVFYKELDAEQERAHAIARALRTEARAAVATTIDKHHPGL